MCLNTKENTHTYTKTQHHRISLWLRQQTFISKAKPCYYRCVFWGCDGGIGSAPAEAALSSALFTHVTAACRQQWRVSQLLTAASVRLFNKESVHPGHWTRSVCFPRVKSALMLSPWSLWILPYDLPYVQKGNKLSSSLTAEPAHFHFVTSQRAYF